MFYTVGFMTIFMWSNFLFCKADYCQMKGGIWMYFYQMSMLEILRNSLLCFLFYDSTEFSIWKKRHMYKTLLSLQKNFMWRQNFLIFSLFIKRSGNRRNAPKLSYMYICTFQDINKQTLLQWQLTSYHNIIIHFTFTHK